MFYSQSLKNVNEMFFTKTFAHKRSLSYGLFYNFKNNMINLFINL